MKIKIHVLKVTTLRTRRGLLPNPGSLQLRMKQRSGINNSEGVEVPQQRVSKENVLRGWKKQNITVSLSA